MDKKPNWLRPDPSTWPPGVRPISLDEMDALGLDADHSLYWNGKRVRTSLALTFWQLFAAVVATLSLAATGLKDGVELLRLLGVLH